MEGIAAVRAQAAAWDGLWERSDESSPAARCEPVCLWHEHFHPQTPLRVVKVLEGDRLIALLPLSLRHWPAVGTLPSNDWVAGGTLLTDPASDAARVADCLVDGLSRLQFVGCVLRGAPIERASWRAFVEASQRARWSHLVQPLHEIGTIDLRASWEETETRLGGNYRRQMAKAQRRMEAAGSLVFETRDTWADGCNQHSAQWDLESALREGFELEARGWKGEEGTAITQQPSLMAFVARHANALARTDPSPPVVDREQGEVTAASGVRIATLRFDGRLIAFLCCWRGKDCLFTPKIAYDETFAACSPGKLVFYWNLRSLLRAGDCRSLDMAGPLAEDNAKWSTGTYSVATLVLGRPGLRGRLLVAAYAARRQLRNWRRTGNAAFLRYLSGVRRTS
ncbi:MAG: GNAT family N-acetyltransferase [Planctomycetota bacterium]